MSATVLSLVLAELVVLTLAVSAWFRRPQPPSWVVTAVRGTSTELARRLPRPVAAAVVVVVGGVLVLLVGFGLGKLAHAVEPVVDVPLFHWAQQQVMPGTTWHHTWTTLTQMGNRRQMKTVVVVGSVVLALVWWRRRRPFLIPPAALVTGYLLEKVAQRLLKAAVHRGHPVTSRGTWFSGGCARLVIVSGIVAILVVLVLPPVRRRLAGYVLGTCVAVLAVAEAYSRVYLLKHWFTDVLGGLVVGTLILGVVATALVVLVDRPSPVRPSDRGTAAGSPAARR